MKSVLVVTLVMFLALSAAAQTTHLKFTQSGPTVSVSGSTDPNSSFLLNVSSLDSSTSGAGATIFYEAISFTPVSETFTEIVGAIPADALTGHNTQNIAVNFDTSMLDPTTSISVTCTVDLTTFLPPACGPAAAGVIQLHFRENGAQRTQVLALETVTTLGPVTTRTHQKSDNGSANAEGSIFGTPISSTNASVGVNHTSTLEVISTH